MQSHSTLFPGICKRKNNDSLIVQAENTEGGSQLLSHGVPSTTDCRKRAERGKKFEEAFALRELASFPAEDGNDNNGCRREGEKRERRERSAKNAERERKKGRGAPAQPVHPLQDSEQTCLCRKSCGTEDGEEREKGDGVQGRKEGRGGRGCVCVLETTGDARERKRHGT